MYFDIDLYVRMWCADCDRFFLYHGNQPSALCKCPHCGSKNWDFATLR